ncbi:MAG: cardiolipin synthase ClsB, partial [Rhodoferax sp.]|nr:cardiolipin synthase ClsB [Rhodoferax sp.]
MTDYCAGHQLQLLEGAREFFASLVADVERATKEVRIETYIFDFAGSGAR